MSNKLFSPAPFFMVRTPGLSHEDFLKSTTFSDKDLFSFFDENEWFRSAVSIASPSLYEAASNRAKKTSKELEQIASSLLKYYLRMTTRGTPFGLFAFVSEGHWDEKTNITYDLNQVQLRVRPDMAWLFGVVDHIVADERIFPFLKVKTNQLVYSSGGRLHLAYYRTKEDAETKSTLSIRSNSLIVTLLESAEYPISVVDLEQKVNLLIQDLDLTKVRTVIKSLIKQQFLQFDLEPTLLTHSPLEDLLEKLAEMPRSFDDSTTDLIEKLKKLPLSLGEMNKKYANQCETDLLTLSKQMQETVKTPFSLQVDAYYSPQAVTLSREIAEELSNAVEALWQVAFSQDSLLKEYLQHFIDRYGFNRTVSLWELVNQDVGLGYPKHFKDTPTSPPNMPPKYLSEWMTAQYWNCLINSKQEIVLTKQNLELIRKSPAKIDAPASLDIFFEIYFESIEKLAAGDFQLVLGEMSQQGCSTLGRFLELFSSNYVHKLKKFIQEEHALTPTTRYVESSYIHYNSRNNNLGIHPPLSEYKLDLASNNIDPYQIKLSDIYVGATSDRLYLTNQTGSFEYVINFSNMLNPMHAPPPIRLIREISRMKAHTPSAFQWMQFSNNPFLPRIRFERTILSPARWVPSLMRIGAMEKDSKDVIREKFLAWARTWRLPQYVLLTSSDNRMLLDLTKESHLQQILQSLLKEKSCTLIEKVNPNGASAISKRGRHVSEFVVPFVKNKGFYPRAPLVLKSHHPITVRNRWKVFGDEWLFLKLYLSSDSATRFLIDYLSPYIQYLNEKELIHNWFYVQYADPDFHIRLRLKGDPEKLLNSTLPVIQKWALDLMHNHIIRQSIWSGYEREVERYGGLEVIDFAEELFCEDSNITTQLLKFISSKDNPNLPNYVVAACSIIHLLNMFGENSSDGIIHFSEEDKKGLSDFRKWKNSLIQISSEVLKMKVQDPKPCSVILSNIFNQRGKEAANLLDKLSQLPFFEKKGVIESFIHMHCNRLLGTSRDLEIKARLYAANTFLALMHKNKATKDNV